MVKHRRDFNDKEYETSREESSRVETRYRLPLSTIVLP